MLDLVLQTQLDALGVHSQLLEHVVRHVFALVHHAGKDVNRLDGLLSIALRRVQRALDSLLGFDGEFVKCHICFSFLCFLSFGSGASGGSSRFLLLFSAE